MRAFLLALLSILAFTSLPDAETKMLRYPDIHQNKIVFCYGANIWTADIDGSNVRQLTTHIGQELFPKFSPDGKWIAFTAQYDGNMDVYIMPSNGGVPRRLTFHPGNDQVIEWHPDGQHVIFRSTRNSFTTRFKRLHSVSIDGNKPEVLPLPKADLASYNSDGSKLVYNNASREFRTWKRYRGGWTADIWIWDTNSQKVELAIDSNFNDHFPMWSGDTIYFQSDRDDIGKRNIWSYDTTSKEIHQITYHKEYDANWPSVGGDRIVYEHAGGLRVYDISNAADFQVPITIHSDLAGVRPEFRNVSEFIQYSGLSPSGKRALFAARGDIFTVPAENGPTRNLSKSPGANERSPVWSPNGKYVAYASDMTGEYQIYRIPANGQGNPEQLTTTLKSFLVNLSWSPDGTRIGFSDATNRYYVLDVETKELREIFHAENNTGGNHVDANWSPDSKWLTYSKPDESQISSVYLYNLQEDEEYRVTDYLTQDYAPAFDPEGKYLYWVTSREVNPNFDLFEFNYSLINTDKIVCATLDKDAIDPFYPESDEAQIVEDHPEKPTEENDSNQQNTSSEDEAIKIDLEGLATRMVNLPVPDSSYNAVYPINGGVVYISSQIGLPPRLELFDFKTKEYSTILNGIGDFRISGDGKKILYSRGNNWFIIDATANQKPQTGMLDLDNLSVTIDYRAEWNQIFYEAWRLERDFFYDRSMHGVDWQAMKHRYEVMLPHLAHRSDLTYLIGEMLGELNVGHAYVGGGDYPDVASVNTGLLAADLAAGENGYYKIAKIYAGQSWDPNRRSPLTRPGLNVEEGYYILKINGKEIKAPANPLAMLVDTVNEQVTLTVNDKPTLDGARDIVVRPIGNDAVHRYIDWVMSNIEKVNDATNGEVGYIHLPDTQFGGIEWFTRLFYPQIAKKGLIVDVRFNGGGFLPTPFMERLGRRVLQTFYVPYSKAYRLPFGGMFGPKVCLANAWSASGGDAFPHYFRTLELGPIIGTRTWGGLVGISGSPSFTDGGQITMPDNAFVNNDGEWDIENQGVSPDIELRNHPTELMKGNDQQLEKAIEVVLELMQKAGDQQIKTPKTFPDRSK